MCAVRFATRIHAPTASSSPAFDTVSLCVRLALLLPLAYGVYISASSASDRLQTGKRDADTDVVEKRKCS